MRKRLTAILLAAAMLLVVSAIPMPAAAGGFEYAGDAVITSPAAEIPSDTGTVTEISNERCGDCGANMVHTTKYSNWFVSGAMPCVHNGIRYTDFIEERFALDEWSCPNCQFTGRTDSHYEMRLYCNDYGMVLPFDSYRDWDPACHKTGTFTVKRECENCGASEMLCSLSYGDWVRDSDTACTHAPRVTKTDHIQHRSIYRRYTCPTCWHREKLSGESEERTYCNYYRMPIDD